MGACCLHRNGEVICRMMSEAVCEAQGGEWNGVGTTCDDKGICEPECNCDWNDDGTINNADLNAFLTDYLEGEADFNGDGATTPMDIADFLDCLRECRD